MLLRGIAIVSVCCLLSATAIAQEPAGGYTPPPTESRSAAAEAASNDSIPQEIFERARKWRPNEQMDSRFAPTFYKRAKPSHLPPQSVMNQPGFVPEVRTKSSWRDGLSWLTSLQLFGN